MSFEDESLEEDRMIKRVFLKEEIINHGYNPQDFIYFCETGRGADIDIYSLEQLQGLVEVFKKQKADAEKAAEENQYSHSSVPSGPFESVQLQEEEMAHSARRGRHSLLFDETTIVEARSSRESDDKKKCALEPVQEFTADEALHDDLGPEPVADVTEVRELPSNLPQPPLAKSTHRSPEFSLRHSLTSRHSHIEGSDYVDSSYTIQVQALPDTELSMVRQPKVIISEPEFIDSGFFSRAFIQYRVQTKPLGWDVKRSYRDFVWLRQSLVSSFPGYFIPPVPTKQYINSLSEETALKRQRFLKRFMDSIITSAVFTRSSFLVEFLQQNKSEVFVAFQEGATKAKKVVKSPFELKSETGVVTCYPSLSQTYINQLKEFVAGAESIKKNLKRKSAGITSSLKHVSAELIEFSLEVKHLSSLHTAIAEAKCHREIYQSVSSLLNEWGQYHAKLATIVNEYLTMFFKYRYTEMTALGELLREREEFKDLYLKAEGRLMAKKERMWQHKHEFQKWELDITDISRHNVPELLDNKEFAFSHMLPVETTKVKHLRDMYGFMHYQTHADTAKLLAETMQIESLHFADMARVYDEKTQNMCQEWREMIMKLSGFFPRSQAYEL